ncbi:MAG: putative metal-binding motif-containing protein [Myxococcota bacterium]
MPFVVWSLLVLHGWGLGCGIDCPAGTREEASGRCVTLMDSGLETGPQDGSIDGPSCESSATYYPDTDEDMFGDPMGATVACEAPDGFVAQAGDCDDGRNDRNPDAPEVCDLVDNDCDGNTDEGLRELGTPTVLGTLDAQAPRGVAIIDYAEGYYVMWIEGTGNLRGAPVDPAFSFQATPGTIAPALDRPSSPYVALAANADGPVAVRLWTNGQAGGSSLSIQPLPQGAPSMPVPLADVASFTVAGVATSGPRAWLVYASIADGDLLARTIDTATGAVGTPERLLSVTSLELPPNLSAVPNAADRFWLTVTDQRATDLNPTLYATTVDSSGSNLVAGPEVTLPNVNSAPVIWFSLSGPFGSAPASALLLTGRSMADVQPVHVAVGPGETLEFAGMGTPRPDLGVSAIPTTLGATNHAGFGRAIGSQETQWFELPATDTNSGQVLPVPQAGTESDLRAAEIVPGRGAAIYTTGTLEAGGEVELVAVQCP